MTAEIFQLVNEAPMSLDFQDNSSLLSRATARSPVVPVIGTSPSSWLELFAEHYAYPDRSYLPDGYRLSSSLSPRLTILEIAVPNIALNVNHLNGSTVQSLTVEVHSLQIQVCKRYKHVKELKRQVQESTEQLREAKCNCARY